MAEPEEGPSAAADDAASAANAVEILEKAESFPTNALVGRSDSWEVLLDSVSTDCLGMSGYEKLPRSISDGEERGQRLPAKAPAKNLLNRFLHKKSGVGVGGNNGDGKEGGGGAAPVEEEKEKKGKGKEKKRSSWLPDPEKRWPVQGWN